MLTPTGPQGRGSIPALVMRTGLIQPVNPANVRRDLTTQHVLQETMWPTDHAIPPELLPGPPASPAPTVMPLLPAPPSPVTTAVAQTVVSVPPQAIQAPAMMPPSFRPSDRHHWHMRQRMPHPMVAEIRRLHPKAQLHGTSDVELGEWNGRPIAKFEIASAPKSATAAAHALMQAAHVLRRAGLQHLPPELVAGPLAALMRGGAVELHFQNGAVARAAL